MASALPLRAALERGALVTAANWPLLVVEFTIESLFKFALAVPIVGGAFMVAVLVGADVRSIFEEGVQSAADRVASSLATAPVALASFSAAVLIVATGGTLLMFAVKAGTLAVLAEGERAAPELGRGPVRREWFRRAQVFQVSALVAGVRRFGGRAAALGLWLGAAYALGAAAYLALVRAALHLTPVQSGAAAIWPLVLVLATCLALILLATVDVVYDLMRVIVVLDDCGLRAAAGRLRRFVVTDAREVISILGVMSAVVVVATAVALLAAAGLAFVAYVPVVGLIFLPLQAAAWLVRGLLFQQVSLMTLAAYQTQYRRYSAPPEPDAQAARLWMQRA